jgi:hypothetical protein
VANAIPDVNGSLGGDGSKMPVRSKVVPMTTAKPSQNG